MVKNQFMFELQLPNIVTERYVTEFVKLNFLEFCTERYAVILT